MAWWWRVSRDGTRIEPVKREVALRIPAAVAWTRDGARAAWFNRGELRTWQHGNGERRIKVRADAAPMPFVVPRKKDETVPSLHVSPGGKYTTYVVAPKVEEVQTIFGGYVNDSGVVYTKTSRAKVGAPLAQTRAVIVAGDPFAIPDSVKAVVVDTGGFGKPVRVLSFSWNRQGTHLLAEFASNDDKERWPALVDPATGKQIRTLHHEHDDDWILESPGIPNEVHLYRMPATGGAMTRVDSLGEGESADWRNAISKKDSQRRMTKLWEEILLGK
jgi:hypothetical protein